MTCPDTITYDWATVSLGDNTAATKSTPLAKTCTSNAWTSVTVTITAGHSYTLTLTSHDDNYAGDPTFTLFDDVATS
jgi:serine protease